MYAIFGRSLFALRWMTILAFAVNVYVFHLIAKRVAPCNWRTCFLTGTAIYLASPLYGFFTALTLHDYLLVTLVLVSGYFFTCFFTDVETTGAGRQRDLFLGVVFLGLATLTKYNGVPRWRRGDIADPAELRHLLRDWRLWAAALLAMAIQAPVLIWNAQQGFASFLFQMGTRHGASGFSGFSGLDFGRMKLFAGEAMLMVSPFMVPIVLLFFWARQKDPFERVGKTIAIVAFWVSTLVCLYVSNFSWVIWWWNIVAYVMVFPFAARYVNPVLLWLHIGWGVLVSTILASLCRRSVQALLGRYPAWARARLRLGPDHGQRCWRRKAQGAGFLLTNRFERRASWPSRW